MDMAHGVLLGVVTLNVAMVAWAVYTSQRSFRQQSQNGLQIARMVDRVERMTERLLTQSAEGEVSH